MIVDRKNTMKKFPFTKILLRMLTALSIAVVVVSLSVPAQAKPSAANSISSIDAFQQVAAGQGWILFDGKLYWTNDNGADWSNITPAQDDIQAVTFLSASRGWVVASDMDGFSLASTADGGMNWRARAVALPEMEKLDAPIAKVLMGWRTDSHGWLVFKLATNSNFSRGVLYVTFDGGVTWTKRNVPLGEPVTFTDANNGWIEGGAAGDQFYRTRDGGLSWESARENGEQIEVQNEAGWTRQESGECAEGVCVREVQLLTSQNGIPIRLPNGQVSLRESFSVREKSFLPDTDTKAYEGQGFDTCEIPNLTKMQAWWNSSPYSAVNLYIGGISRGCSNAALTSSYVSQMHAQGWRFFPTWVGLQASCSGYPNRMSSNVTTAYNQGVAEADAASAAAQNLGLTNADGSGTVIYFDLEAYDTTNATCRAAANAFINGWTFQLKARGNLAGVYGASCGSAPTDWWSITNVPDALWIANWYGNPGTVSYTPTASVWNAACLSNSLWPNHQRLRQYAGTHTETWGAQAISIDSNVLDGPLTVPNGTGDSSAPSAPSNPIPASGSTLDQTDDTWLYWKTTGDTCSIHIWGGALNTTVANNCSSYHLGVLGGGAYSWQVTSTNGFGSTVGPTWTFSIPPASPSGLTAVPVSSTRVNLTWTLSSDEPAIDNYLIFADGNQVANVSGGVNSYQVQNLACNSTHSFYVVAVQQGAESDPSNTADATTGSCAPVLVSPIGGALADSLQPTFIWQSVDGASQYQIQVSSSSTFTSLQVNATSSATSYTSLTGLYANRLYYWRVRAFVTSGYGDWASSSFTTPNPPPAPGLLSPSSNALVTDYTPRFDWRDVTAPIGTTLDHYQIQIASDVAFTNLLHNENVTASEFTPLTEFAPNTRNYWRVRSFNTLGHSGPWSLAFIFRAAMLPPNPISPAAGEALLNRRPSFDWGDTAGASSYTLVVSSVSTFTSILKTVNIIGSNYNMPTDLPANATLYWRVRANGLNGPSLWSGARSFHTANPPSVPILLSPRNSLLINDLTPLLTWRAVTLPAGTTFDHYQIQVAADVGFASLILNETVATVSPSQFTLTTPLLPNARYYWRVRSFNASGEYSAWSTVWYFRTSATAVFEWMAGKWFL